MLVVKARNVNIAYERGLRLLREHGVLEWSRAGMVLVVPQPVTTHYLVPTERVLFDPVRDANPFFHVMESVWMLSGSRDARWLDAYVSDFSSRFAEDDGMAHGAYGHRWRMNFESSQWNQHSVLPDQLLLIGDMLLKDFATRRAVLTMWDPGMDLGAQKNDIPCNTHVYFRGHQTANKREVHISVCCRSNDIAWGAYGANAVHMSVMGEVVAGLAGAHLGEYWQVSNNYHAYTNVLDRLAESTSEDPYWEFQSSDLVPIVSGETAEERRASAVKILRDAEMFVSRRAPVYTRWFTEVVLPMAQVHTLWKAGSTDEAVEHCHRIRSRDWRVACERWMQRRIERRRAR